ncbi:DUF3618 domain-containing protein [Sulfitobacter aestuarii]|uniref:DUF3618 domain-containing protein n=1 Tax=Sulfitobacter aestuarii TaxID=2161676 RepID=A0ABW5U048_9RHOB
MTNDPRSPEEIERDIERNRAQLTGNLDALQDRFSLDGFMQQIGDQLRDHGGELGESISRTVKQNPAAVALTGIGLAWMIFGGKSSGSSTKRSLTRRDDYRSDLDDYSARRRVTMTRPDPRMKGGTVGEPDWLTADDDDDDGLRGRVSSAAGSARDRVTGAASSASDKARHAGSSVRDSVGGAAHSASDKARQAGASARAGVSNLKQRAGETAHAAQERAARLRQRLSEGTENLSEEARQRVIAAREAALDARRRASEAMAHSSRQAAELYDSQPLIAGALAVAVGAAIGGALPRTRTEDDLMGAQSDRLIEEAERIYREEREKAGAVVEAAKDEAVKIAKETRENLDSGAPGDKTAGEALADEARNAGERVADAAAKEADKKNLGKMSS